MEYISISSFHFASIADSFYNNIILENRYLLILDGLQTTLFISILSVLLGTMLGALLCSMRMSKRRSLEFAARIYISLVRGTPVLVLLMIIFYVAFARVNINPVLVAVIAFALNFAAYVAEMFRTSIESVDKGQTEAGIAGGFNRGQTFVYIVMPQAVQRLLPVYKGEVISLVKMTSVVGYIAVQDLTKAGDIIRSRTFDAFFPLLMTAMLYFALSYLLITLLNTVEKKSDPQLRKNPHHSTQAKYLLVLSILAAGAALIYTCWPSSAPVDLPRSGPITRLSQLDGKRICVITGTPGDFAVHARYKKAQILDMVYTADAALAVRTGKADAFAFDINTLRYLAANSDGQFVILPGLIAQAEIAIPMRPDARELHQKINAGIEKLKNDGTLDEMYRRWFTGNQGHEPQMPVIKLTGKNGTVRMGTCSLVEPFAYISHGKLTGFDIELGYRLAQIMGVDLVITDMTFDTMSPALNAGKIDIAIANFFKYEEREKYFVFSDPYMTGDVAVLVRKE